MKITLLIAVLGFSFFNSCAQQPAATGYRKMEIMIPMRDGVKLFTAVYLPLDSSENYPILMQRTPYSVAPYGEQNLRRNLGPNKFFAAEKYIYVYQDVRGRHMSEGSFEEMTPAIDNKKSKSDIDESSDTYDTVEWLLKNIHNNNGKVGIYGISYPGFYATAALPNAHPAIKAVSPQAPVTDEFEGDDAYHRGAFFLMDNFSFMNFFDHPRPQPIKQYPQLSSNIKIDDAYDFYLKTGALKNFNDTYFKGQSKIWNEYLQHATNDGYWQARNIRKHLYNVKPATLVVGGLFDAEDMFGAINTYQAIEKQNKGNDNRFVFGPWTHGAWESKDWNHFGSYNFNSNTAEHLQQIEFDFFNHYLKDKGNYTAAEATVFFTGSNEWKSFDVWPPKNTSTATWSLNANHELSLDKPKPSGYDEYVSDPANPVPYINQKSDDRINEYLCADQSFASKRSDVLYYQSTELKNDMTICGPITVNLSASISTTDADFIVKVIDLLPDGSQTQQLVRAEILRGKFRNSFEKPEAFVPNKITDVKLVLNDMAHTFLKGHKIMIQVQSSWFPIVDRNPQQFMDIPSANDSDFKKSTIRIYHDAAHPSSISVMQLN